MVRLLAMLLAFTVTLIPVSAQQKAKGSGSSVQVENIFQETEATEAFAASQTFLLTITVNRQANFSHLGQITRRLFVTGPTFIVKDGAVHLSTFQDTLLLIPMPGGRASGCFSLDLPERIEEMRKTFQILAPLPQQSRDKSH